MQLNISCLYCAQYIRRSTIVIVQFYQMFHRCTTQRLLDRMCVKCEGYIDYVLAN